MATLGELSRQYTSLQRDEIDHLQRLIGEWGLLADLSFADLLLYVPGTDGKWMVIAHVRPATGQTIYAIDYVGTADPVAPIEKAVALITELLAEKDADDEEDDPVAAVGGDEE